MNNYKNIIERFDFENSKTIRGEEYFHHRSVLLSKKKENYLSTTLQPYLNWRRKLLKLKSSDYSEEEEMKKNPNVDKSKVFKRYTTENVLFEIKNEGMDSGSVYTTEDTLGDHLSTPLSDEDEPTHSLPRLPSFSSTDDLSLFLNSPSRFSISSVDREEDVDSENVQSAYSFEAMHLFVDCQSPIKQLKFANLNDDLFAFSCENGEVFIGSSQKKVVLHELKGHIRPCSDFDWNSMNDVLITSSYDRTIRVWQVDIGNCIRTMICEEPIESIKFLPFNNNRFVVGYHRKKVFVFYNYSTGKPIQKFKLKSYFGCFCFNPRGDSLFVGDAKGYLYHYKFSTSEKQRRGGGIKIKRMATHSTHKNKFPILSMDFSSWVRGGKKEKPLLLVNPSLNCTFLYSVNMKDGSFDFVTMFPPRAVNIKKKFLKAVFCPLISNRGGACFVVGGENCNVYIFDVTKPGKKNINTLQGHGGAVNCVSWNFNESILATGDSKGVIILWIRKKGQTDEVE